MLGFNHHSTESQRLKYYCLDRFQVQGSSPPWRDGISLCNYFRIIWAWLSVTPS